MDGLQSLLGEPIPGLAISAGMLAHRLLGMSQKEGLNLSDSFTARTARRKHLAKKRPEGDPGTINTLSAVGTCFLSLKQIGGDLFFKDALQLQKRRASELDKLLLDQGAVGRRTLAPEKVE